MVLEESFFIFLIVKGWWGGDGDGGLRNGEEAMVDGAYRRLSFNFVRIENVCMFVVYCFGIKKM